MRRRRFTFWIIVTVTLLAGLVSLPESYRIRFDLGGLKIDQTVRGPDLNFSFGPVNFRKDFRTALGLDLAGGSHLVFEANLKDIPEGDREEALSSARDVIERRVNFFGVSEANVQTARSAQGARIIVELPGLEDTQQAINLIGKTAQLNFRIQEATPSADIDKEATAAARFGPFTGKTELTGRNLRRAQVQFDQQSGKPAVSLKFDEKGADLFERITRENIGEPVAIFLDDQLISAPTVQQEISGGQAVITGQFTTEEARRLSTQLNAGALPVPVELVEQRTVGPSLGESAIAKSVRAGVVGIGLVILFMVGYYGRLGLVASAALIIYGLITLAIFKTIPVVLTLSGIAGFMLSIGMAVDANILIFERMREEIRSGRPFKQAMELGFGRAWDSIRDANVATLLTTFILFNPLNWTFLPRFGMIRGFALTLAIGVLVGLFTGVVVTRNLMRVFYKDN